MRYKVPVENLSISSSLRLDFIDQCVGVLKMTCLHFRDSPSDIGVVSVLFFSEDIRFGFDCSTNFDTHSKS